MLRPPPPPIHLPFHFEPHNNNNGRYYDDDEDETPEYRLNLGAETPGEMTPSISSYAFAWERPGSRTPVRRRSLSSLRRSSKPRRDVVDRDCGICFESAVVPCRTLCCSKLFCLEHIADWLHGSRSDGRCPSCKTRCTLKKDTILLPVPHLHSPIPPTPPPSLRLRPRSPSTSGSETSDVGSEESEDSPDVDHGYHTDTLDLSGTKVASKILSIVGLTLVFYVLLT
ncbi:hypothetical protein IW261DRAFT_653909 [Armillaria novae-zelandiae]|uniref:RING-type domain-containing protein n=1 Tax=Armillaria novae-zelandiae TaxID=153914 RepID=A0AA39UHN1_9AGAR|nr:hypothetical protein IW261DRAFT_653909 [Armillaria novae-zelandiae]